jgi:hypothetical protein
LVQVKHHSGTTGSWGYEQLKTIKEVTDKYSDHEFILMTSGHVPEEIKVENEILGISTIDGENLVDLIYETLADLNQETKITLGISTIPSFLN